MCIRDSRNTQLDASVDFNLPTKGKFSNVRLNFKNLNSSLNSTNQLGSTLNGIDSLSCSADGSCDGKVILDKTTNNNY